MDSAVSGASSKTVNTTEKADWLANNNQDVLKLVAEIHLGVVFPSRKFDILLRSKPSRFCIEVIASFENKHGRQYVAQYYDMGYRIRDFRWSDDAITQMMLLE